MSNFGLRIAAPISDIWNSVEQRAERVLSDYGQKILKGCVKKAEKILGSGVPKILSGDVSLSGNQFSRDITTSVRNSTRPCWLLRMASAPFVESLILAVGYRWITAIRLIACEGCSAEAAMWDSVSSAIRSTLLLGRFPTYAIIPPNHNWQQKDLGHFEYAGPVAPSGLTRV